jgi:hypothetical protein
MPKIILEGLPKYTKLWIFGVQMYIPSGNPDVFVLFSLPSSFVDAILLLSTLYSHVSVPAYVCRTETFMTLFSFLLSPCVTVARQPKLPIFHSIFSTSKTFFFLFFLTSAAGGWAIIQEYSAFYEALSINLFSLFVSPSRCRIRIYLFYVSLYIESLFHTQ